MQMYTVFTLAGFWTQLFNTAHTNSLSQVIISGQINRYIYLAQRCSTTLVQVKYCYSTVLTSFDSSHKSPAQIRSGQAHLARALANLTCPSCLVSISAVVNSISPSTRPKRPRASQCTAAKGVATSVFGDEQTAAIRTVLLACSEGSGLQLRALLCCSLKAASDVFSAPFSDSWARV